MAPGRRGGSSRRKQNLENGGAGHRQRRKWGRHTQQPLDFEIPMRNRFLLAFLLPLASALVAQTYVVDAANGPGSQFTDLPTAVAAVPDGATLLVRPLLAGEVPQHILLHVLVLLAYAAAGFYAAVVLCRRRLLK